MRYFLINFSQRMFVFSRSLLSIFFRPDSLLCPEHDAFCCERATRPFYDTLPGQFRCLLALALLEPRIPGLEPPPLDFILEKYDFDDDKRAQRLPDSECRHQMVTLERSRSLSV